MSRIRRFAPHVKVRHTNYFRLIAEESGVTFTMTIGANVPTTSLAWIEYSVDEGKNWNRTYNVNNSKITITMPKINTNQSIIMRGNGRSLGFDYKSTADYTQIKTNSKRYKVCGILMTLLKGALADKDTLLDTDTEYSFRTLFASTRITHADELIMPPNVTKDCFNQMFAGCTYLVSAPLLQAETLVHGCYKRMFSGCTSLSYIKMLALDLTHLPPPVSDNATYEWVKMVAETGTFDKNKNAIWTDTGISGVPSGWTVRLVDP